MPKNKFSIGLKYSLGKQYFNCSIQKIKAKSATIYKTAISKYVNKTTLASDFASESEAKTIK